jgi:RNA polymerase sigma-70 factor (ECF subfamily)
VSSDHYRQAAVPAAHEGDASADSDRYDEFVREYTRACQGLYAWILTHVPDPNLADDLMQETGLLLWRKFDDFAPGTDFPRWARSCARNLVRNYRRHHRRHRHLAFDDALLVKLARTQQAAEEWLEVRREALAGCMDKLSLAERKLIRHCYIKHETLTAAAADLNTPPNAIYKRLRRIRLKLSRCIERTLGLGDTP